MHSDGYASLNDKMQGRLLEVMNENAGYPEILEKLAEVVNDRTFVDAEDEAKRRMINSFALQNREEDIPIG